MSVASHGAVPRLLRWVSVATLVAGVVLIFAGGLRVGVTYDEPLHVQRFNNYLETGWYLGDGQVVAGEPTENMRQQYVYAPATMLLLHGLGVVVGVEEPAAASTSSEAYAVRHLGIGVISLLGLWAVAATGRVLFRRWDWGLFAAATLVAVPLWTGHSMFNVKDVSVATGYALATLGLAVIARNEHHAARVVRWGGPLALALGAFLALGTRPGIWSGVAAGCGLLVAYRFVQGPSVRFVDRVRRDLWRYRDLAVGLLLAYAGLLAIYPKVFDSPVEALVRSAFSSANFLSVAAPWTFIPSRVAFQVPFLIVGFLLLGTYVAIRAVVAARRAAGSDETRLVLVLGQMMTLPMIAIIHGASLYGDLRQVLFAAPATALVATLGVARLVALVEGRREVDRTGPPLVAAVVAAALVVPMAAQALAFPYGYTYYNPLAKVAGLPVQGDYYRASGREIAPDLPVGGRIICTPEADESGRALRSAHVDGWVDCTDPASSPIAAFADQREREAERLAPDEFWTVTFNSRGRVPKNCEKVTSVARRLVLRRLELAALSRCQLPFPVLPSGLVEFSASSDLGKQVPDQGWRAYGVDGTTDGIAFRGGPSTMTFGLAAALRGQQVRLVLETTGEIDRVTARYGDADLEPRWTDESTLVLTLPVDLVARAVAAPLTLELTPPGDGQGAKVLSLAVEAD